MVRSLMLFMLIAAGVMHSSSGNRTFELWHFASVVYPPLAHIAQIEGTVVVDVTLGKDGEIAHIDFVSGHPLLQRGVREQMGKIDFSCGACSSPKGMKYRFTYNFQIDRACDENAGCYEASTVYQGGQWTVKASRPQINN